MQKPVPRRRYEYMCRGVITSVDYVLLEDIKKHHTPEWVNEWNIVFNTKARITIPANDPSHNCTLPQEGIFYADYIKSHYAVNTNYLLK